MSIELKYVHTRRLIQKCVMCISCIAIVCHQSMQSMVRSIHLYNFSEADAQTRFIRIISLQVFCHYRCTRCTRRVLLDVVIQLCESCSTEVSPNTGTRLENIYHCTIA